MELINNNHCFFCKANNWCSEQKEAIQKTVLSKEVLLKIARVALRALEISLILGAAAAIIAVQVISGIGMIPYINVLFFVCGFSLAVIIITTAFETIIEKAIIPQLEQIEEEKKRESIILQPQKKYETFSETVKVTYIDLDWK